VIREEYSDNVILILMFHHTAAGAQAMLFSIVRSNADAILTNRQGNLHSRHGFSFIVMSKRFKDQSCIPSRKRRLIEW
jgi:hypothetical protein